MKEKFIKSIKNLCKIELVLAIFFLAVPFLLPITSGVLLTSISAYAYVSSSSIFLPLLVIIGYFIIVDGLLDKTKRYNIVLGFLLVLVTAFPVDDHRIIHDLVAILFFIGNMFVITWHSNVIPKWLKRTAFILIVLVVGAFFLGFITLFIAEGFGFFLMSWFMFKRYLKRLNNNK